MKSLILQVTFILCFSSLGGCLKKNTSRLSGSSNARHGATIPGPIQDSDWVPQLGAGYDSAVGEPSPEQCVHYGDLSNATIEKATPESIRTLGIDPNVDGFKMDGGNLTASIGIKQNQSFESFTRNIGGGVSGELTLSVITAKGSLQFALDHTDDDFTATQTIFGHYILGVQHFPNAIAQVLTSAGQRIKAENLANPTKNIKDAVIARCGDQIVTQVNYGADFMATLKVKASSKTDALKVAADIAIQMKMIKGDGSGSIDDIKTKSKVSISLAIKQIGGDPVMANSALSPKLAVCNQSEIKACMEALQTVYAYFSTKFPAQFYDKDGNLRTNKLHVMSARTTPITEIVLKELSGAKKEIPPCESLLCETEVKQMNSVIKVLNNAFLDMERLKQRGTQLINDGYMESGSANYQQFLTAMTNVDKRSDLFISHLTACLRSRSAEVCMQEKQKAFEEAAAFPVDRGLFVGELMNLEAYCKLYAYGTASDQWASQAEQKTMQALEKLSGINIIHNEGENPSTETNCASFAKYFNNLQELNVGEDFQIETLRPMTLMKNLKYLKLTHQKLLGSGHDAAGNTAKGYDGIMGIPNLQTLTVIGGGLNNLEPLKGLGKLRELSLTGLQDLPADALAMLSQNMVKLENVNISQSTVKHEEENKFGNGFICAFVKNLNSLKILRAQSTLFDTADFTGCENTTHQNFPKLELFDYFQSKLPSGFTTWCPASNCRS